MNNNQLNNQLFNPSLEQVPVNISIDFLKNLNSKYVPINQSPSSTQKTSMNNIQKPENNKKERRRRSRYELTGRNFTCECGKSYLSQPALSNHIKTKHLERLEGQPKRNRGRPPKYPKKYEDFEHSKYDNFFALNDRSPKDGSTFDIVSLIQEVFNYIYESSKADKLFSKPKSFNDIPVLFNLVSRGSVTTKPQNEKTCDEVFTEYLITFINKTNRQYFSFILKFILLFRECYEISKNKDKKEDEKKAVTKALSPDGLPDLCNEFYGEFLEMNNFFGIDKNEIIDIIQHFCIWLFKNGYTKSKLVLAS